MNPHMLPKVRSDALKAAIEGMPCTLRLASFGGMSCAPQDTVVGCHLPVWGKGTSTKVTDLAIAAGCATCHDLLDERNNLGHQLMHKYPGAWAMRLLHGLTETHALLVDAGIIEVKGMRIV